MLMRYLLLLLFASFALTSCDLITSSDDTDDPNGGTNPQNEYSGLINQNTTWNKDTYKINGRLTLSGAILTIKPGTIILMGEGSEIVITQGGGLMAEGTAAEPIRFTSAIAQKGYWDYIEFHDSASNAQSVMKFCIFENGGGYSQTGAMIYISNSPTFTDNIVVNSASNGVAFHKNSAAPTFSNNTISGSSNSPIIGYFSNINAIGKGSYAGNVNNYIQLSGNTLSQQAVMQKQSVPYRIKNRAHIQTATLTVEPGTVIEMDNGAEFLVSESGGFIADGTTEQIIITGATKQAGFWDYIEFKESANSAETILKNVLIEYGGGYSTTGGMVYLENNGKIENCTVKNSASHGIKITNSSTQPFLINNTITSNTKSPIQLAPSNLLNLSKGDYAGNTLNYIDVVGGTIDYTNTLEKLNIPYRFTNRFNVTTQTLTIEPGTTILMAAGAEIMVHQSGGFTANGTASEKITISGETKQKGFWDYIEFKANANGAACILNNCLIEFGGGYSTSGAMVYTYNSTPTLTNSTISNSASYGIIVETSDPVDLSTITFSDNTKGDIKSN